MIDLDRLVPCPVTKDLPPVPALSLGWLNLSGKNLVRCTVPLCQLI
jgi:hypothetical protein